MGFTSQRRQTHLLGRLRCRLPHSWPPSPASSQLLSTWPASLSSFLPVPPPLLLPFPCRSRNNKLSLIPSRAGFPSSQVEVPLSIRALKVSSLSKSSSTAFHKGDSSLLTLPKEEASCQDFFKKVVFFFFPPCLYIRRENLWSLIKMVPGCTLVFIFLTCFVL